MNPQPKHTPWRSKEYRKWIESRPFSVSGMPRTCEDMVAAHAKTGGRGTKADDFYCVPMLESEHRATEHQMGRIAFWGPLVPVEDDWDLGRKKEAVNAYIDKVCFGYFTRWFVERNMK